MLYTLITAHLPESQVATQLLDAIKAKETADKIATILDSLTSLDPELGQNRDSKEQRKQHLHVLYTHYPLLPPPSPKTSQNLSLCDYWYPSATDPGS